MKSRGINRVSHYIACWLTVEAWFISCVIYILPYVSRKYTKKALTNLYNLLLYSLLLKILTFIFSYYFNNALSQQHYTSADLTH